MGSREVWLSHRDTGIRVRVTVTKTQGGESPRFSFRDEEGLTVAFVDRELPALSLWARSCKGLPPPGWDLAS